MFRRSLCAFAVAAAIAGVLVGGTGRDASGATGETGQTFRVGLVGDPPSLDIAHDDTALAKEVWTLQYPRLTDYAENDLSPVPSLADAWTPSADGRQFTYRLREGVTWSDGSPVTSADVVASINRARDEGWPGTEGALDDLTARASGPREVVVTSARLDRRLPVVPVPVVPQRDALGVGSGPYVVERHDGNVVRMIANERYWRGRPDFDAIEFEVFDDGEALVDAIRHGDVDAVSFVPHSLFEELNDTKNVTTIFGNDGDYYALTIDTRRAPFDDVRVRRALWLTIDRALLIDRVASGVGHAAELPTVARSTVWGFEEKTRLRLAQQLTNDPARARELLDDAGADGVPVSIAVPPDDALARDTADSLVALLRDTAFEPTIAKGDAHSASVQVVRRAPGDDPDSMLAAFTCGVEDAQWCDPGYDRRYTAQATDLDPVSRLATVRDLQRTLIAQVPEVPLFHPDVLEGYRGDRWRDLARQPGETGPAFFTASAANFRSIEQMAPGSDEVSAVVALIVVVVVVGVAVGATALYFYVRGRTTRRPASEPAPTAS